MENKLWDYPFNQTSHHQIKSKSLIVANQMWAIIIINIATGEKSQDITSFTILTSLAFITKNKLWLDTFYMSKLHFMDI